MDKEGKPQEGPKMVTKIVVVMVTTTGQVANGPVGRREAVTARRKVKRDFLTAGIARA